MPVVTSIHIPHETVSDLTVRAKELPCARGRPVKQGDMVAVFETSKAAIEIPAPIDGYIRYLVTEGSDVEVGAAIAQMAEDEASLAAATVEKPSTDAAAGGAATPIPSAGPRKRISAKARDLIAQFGLDISAFGDKAMISEADVRAVLKNTAATPPRAPGTAAGMPAMNGPIGVPVHSTQPSRRKQGERAVLAAGAPPIMLPSSVAVQRSTRGLKAAIAQHAVLHGNSLAVVIYEVSRLLRRYPDLNAFYQDEKIHYYDEVHVGFALDDGHGLVVPYIHNADQKQLSDLVAECEELMVKYAEERLTNAEVTNGTFAISDLSQFQVPFFVPLIPARQSAILGICSEFVQAGDDGHQTLVLTFDHQVADGRQAACFLNDLVLRLAAYEEAFSLAQKEAKSECFCAACGKSVSELKALQARLFKTMESGDKEVLICSICMAGF